MKKLCIIAIGACFLIILAVAVERKTDVILPAHSGSANGSFLHTVILDAGHGGEDGGAVAFDGTLEKDINLSVTRMIASYFEFFGIRYIPTRTTDISVCDENLLTIRERKRSDILNRYSLINGTPDSVLLSIHQNFYTEPKYNGLQVFYSANNDSSRALAIQIRKSVCGALQPDNKREIKPSGDSIYLLYHATTTSVMVECGFLSNPEELSKLKSDAYDSQLAFYIFRGVLNYFNE